MANITAYNFKSIELTKQCETLLQALDTLRANTNDGTKAVAVAMYQIEANEDFKKATDKDGKNYKSATTFLCDFFDFKRVTVTQYLRVAKWQSKSNTYNEDGKLVYAVYDANGDEFSISQLVEMLSAYYNADKREILTDKIRQRVITADMSVSEIRDCIKVLFPSAKALKEADTDEATDTDEADETPTLEELFKQVFKAYPNLINITARDTNGAIYPVNNPEMVEG